ncbi:MAG: sigma factor-like helix-turn-helix DNA-binding protein [Acidimicrobiales bacterium]
MAERAVIVLRYFADLTTAETAPVLGIPEGTVKTRARRALANLRREPGVPEVIIDG